MRLPTLEQISENVRLFLRFLWAVCGHYFLVGGGAIIGTILLLFPELYQGVRVSGLWLFIALCLIAMFLAWRDEHRKAENEQSRILALEERMKPKMQISGGRSVDKCFIWAGDIFYFRARLESLGAEHIHNVEAHVTEIRRDGEPVELKEVAQLMMHPGCRTLPVLKHKVTGFIDVIKTGLNTQPVLALAWNYASVDADLVASGHTYQIDIAVSAESVPTQMCTFVFAWSGDPFTSKFEML